MDEQLRAVLSREHAAKLRDREEVPVQARKLSAELSAARENGLCDSVVPPRGRWARNASPKVCGSVSSRAGKCKEHYLRDVLKVSLTGHGKGYRPFRQHQVPLGRMSDLQHEALKGLPVQTTYLDCLRHMNEVDPTSPLEPIETKPVGGKLSGPRRRSVKD